MTVSELGEQDKTETRAQHKSEYVLDIFSEGDVKHQQ